MEWISVKDRFPPYGKSVLVATPEGILMCYREYVPKFEHSYWACVCECTEGSGPDNDRVTHWMPLPKPPEETNE